MALEEAFDLEISDDKAQSLTTVKAILDYIEANQ
jgi:acyl carrier protein